MAEQVLQGNVALVTGGASGIGRATASRFAAAGAAVVIADLDADGAERLAKDLVDSGGAAVAAHVDVIDADLLAAAVALAESEFGRLDILSCNAGLASYPVPAMEADPAEFSRIFDVNVNGVWLCVPPCPRCAGPAAARSPSPGR